MWQNITEHYKTLHTDSGRKWYKYDSTPYLFIKNISDGTPYYDSTPYQFNSIYTIDGSTPFQMVQV